MYPTKTKKSRDLSKSLKSYFNDKELLFSHCNPEGEFESTVPSVNIKENEREFNIELAAPGFNKNDLKVDVDDNVLTITAEGREEKKEEDELYTKKEFSYNSFYRSFMLPQSIDAEKVAAKYADGILKLSISKNEKATALSMKKVKIK